MRIQRYLNCAALVAVFAGACTPMTRNAGVDGPSTEKTTMVVENNNWSDMTVYILRDGVRTRMGAVPSMGRATFVLSSALVGGTGEIRVQADPLGSSNKWTSQPILIVPGNQVRFRLENNVALSSYSVY